MTGRLKRGVSIEQAENDAERVAEETMRFIRRSASSIYITAKVGPHSGKRCLRAAWYGHCFFACGAADSMCQPGGTAAGAGDSTTRDGGAACTGASATTLLRQTILESLALSVTGGSSGWLAAAALSGRLRRCRNNSASERDRPRLDGSGVCAVAGHIDRGDLVGLLQHLLRFELL